MKSGYTEAIQIGLTAEEIAVSLDTFKHFGEKISNNELTFVNHMGMWKSELPFMSEPMSDPFGPPSWPKEFYWILKRGMCGFTLHAFGSAGRGLLFRQLRVKNKRFFCIQRADTVKCLKCHTTFEKCLCAANGFTVIDGISLLKVDDLHILNERTKKCKILGDKL